MAKMMKSSTLRWSFGSIHWSGLKVPAVPSPRGTTQAIRLVRSETSKVSIFLAPLSLSGMRFQVGSTPQPSGDTMPRPVTTTRLISALQPRIRRAQQETGGPLKHGPSGFVGTARGRQLFAFFSRNFVASPTVKIVSAASSGISQPNSSSNAITSSTVSRLSAPRSSMKLALSTTLSGSTPRCSTTIFLTRSPISLIVQPRACSIGPDPKTIRAIVVVKLSSQSRIVLIWPRHSRQKAPVNDGQAPHRQYTGFQIPAMAFFACPLVVRLSYFPSLDYKPQSVLGNGPSPRHGAVAAGSNHGHSTIDVNCLPGDIGRFVRAEIDRRRSDILGRSEPCRRNF